MGIVARNAFQDPLPEPVGFGELELAENFSMAFPARGPGGFRLDGAVVLGYGPLQGITGTPISRRIADPVTGGTVHPRVIHGTLGKVPLVTGQAPFRLLARRDIHSESERGRTSILYSNRRHAAWWRRNSIRISMTCCTTRCRTVEHLQPLGVQC